jgi:hypothetical protein
MYNNYVHDLEKVALYVDDQTKVTHDIEIFDNIVDNCYNGIAVSSEQGVVVENISIYRNIVTNCFGIGINVSPWVKDGLKKDIKIHNNTFYKNGGVIIIETSNVENISVLNNICSQNTWFQIAVNNDALDEVTVDYNIVNGEQIHEIAVYGDHYILDYPDFMNTSNMDFHLTENSPAIDAGHPDVQYNDPDSTRNDIGAYYYDQTASLSPGKFILSSDSPNVFSSSTIISYRIQRADFITLKIYDLLGQEIQTLVDEFQEANTHSYPYDGTALANGIYYFRLQVGNDFSVTRKMILIR